ncbi:PASTA domain-containing protein, partial [Streptomyces hygroscopicus]|uniref:PASTA domain-containing protein n=1 Tax=Streptomyces hygroscopicus TaxID=1912 RepID=UPI0036BD3D17
RARAPAPPRAGGGAGPRRAGARLPRRGIVTIVAAVLLLIGLGVGVWYVSVGQFTEVPPVLRKTRAEAEKKLHDAGLDVKVVNEFSDVVPKGKVIGSKPGPGERVRGSVTIRVSQGPPRAEVPNVVGMPLADAKRKIADQGLTVGKITRRFSSETAQGSVLSTSPGSGSVRRPETAVSIVVSEGRPVDVPDVVGDSVAEARSTLQEEGFKVKVAERQVFSEEDKGSVAAQSPSADDRAAKGDTVTLTVSKGPQMIEVPDVTGLKVDEAKQQLEEAGFKVNVDKALLFPGNTVKDQSVEAGDEAPKGSTITIKLDGGVF